MKEAFYLLTLTTTLRFSDIIDNRVHALLSMLILSAPFQIFDGECPCYPLIKILASAIYFVTAAVIFFIIFFCRYRHLLVSAAWW